MNVKYDAVIFIANRFGFGPSATAIAVMGELVKTWKGNIVYGASKMCRELLPKILLNKIVVYDLDERNDRELKILFKKYKNPLIVISMNRIAIKTAKSMGLKSIFIDSLAWFWKEIPKEYLLADTYYYFDIFDINRRISRATNIKAISPILGDLPKPKLIKNKKILAHIGGFETPFIKELSKSYLLLLSEVLNTQNLDIEIIVTGGSRALSYLKVFVKRPNVEIVTLERNNFLNLLNSVSHFITTPGLTSSLEAFYLLTPTSFILPSNLSQWHQLKFFQSYGVAVRKLEWEDYLSFDHDFYNLTEKEAIPMFYELADILYKNKTKKVLFTNNAVSMLQSIPDNTKQKAYIDKIGINGAKFVVEDLLRILI